MMSLFDISTYDDIKSLWENRIRETIALDYKREISQKADEISKDISSFANSEGGVIIYGIAEDKAGLPVYSEGVISNKNSERIQQIISSSISPLLDVKIDVIDVFDKNNALINGKEFLVVKIPKSPFYIHQAKKFYFRQNTITNGFEAVEMTERDIALRYRERINSEQKQKDLILMKQNELKEKISYERMFFAAAIPQVSVVAPISVTKGVLGSILFKKYTPGSFGGELIFEHLPHSPGQPTISGREINSTYLKKHFEINKDRSVFYTYSIEETSPGWGTVISVTTMANLAEFLFAANKFYQTINHTSGIILSLNLSNTNGVDFLYRDAISYQRVPIRENNIYLRKEIPFLPFDVEKTLCEIIEELTEAFGLDGGIKILAFDMRELKKHIEYIKAKYAG